MKYKNKLFTTLFLVLGIAVLSFQAQAKPKDPDRINYIERMAISESNPIKSLVISTVSENYAATGKCEVNYNIQNLALTTLLISSFIDDVSVTNDCTVNIKFVNHSYMPSLSDQTLSYKMSTENGYFMWSCTFSGTSTNIPSGCISNE